MTLADATAWPPADPDRQAAIHRLFDYARRHAHDIETTVDQASLQAAMDHFLLTMTAAVQNMIEALPRMQVNGKKQALLVRPVRGDFDELPAMHAVYWAWNARNRVAHNYVKVVTHLNRILTVNSLDLEVGGSSLEIPKRELMAVNGEDSKAVPAPELDAGRLAQEVLAFWESAYRYILVNRDPACPYTYSDLWQNYCGTQARF